MAAQRKKGKNSNKPKAARSSSAKIEEPIDPKTEPVATGSTVPDDSRAQVTHTETVLAHADSVSVSGADLVEAVADNAAPEPEPLSASEIETALGEHPAERNSLDINTESETLDKIEGVDETVAPETDGKELNLSESEGHRGTSATVGDSARTASGGETATAVAEKTAGEENPAKGDYTSAAAFGAENFSKNEIKTLLVPVNPFHRLIACSIVIVCYSFLGYLFLNGPVAVNAHGLHTVDLPEAGDYVLIFKGDTQDAYGWTIDGRFRNSLEIDMEPIEPEQRVEKVEPIKDLSGADFFSVAEYEVNQPGKYNLWVKWNDPNNRCKGKITLEKDPVEKFIFKWVVGIIGTLALIFMCGIPMTTSKAQSTLQGQHPQA
ncbi:hypothetical protein KF913_16240 [Candidatus Obscuribacterales bacterium]|nr:hypothetical protein [Candidatus Obscuribacterales bacterium]